MEYTILSDVTPINLENSINNAIARGYRPFGGLQVATMPPNKEGVVAIFVQAMLRINENEHWPL